MITGTVVRCDARGAKIALAGGSCIGCGGGHCERRRRLVSVSNPADYEVQPGTVVRIEIRPRQMLRGLLRLAVLPILAGAGVGTAAASLMVRAGHGTAALIGAVAAGVAVLAVAVARGERPADWPVIAEVVSVGAVGSVRSPTLTAGQGPTRAQKGAPGLCSGDGRRP